MKFDLEGTIFSWTSVSTT